MLDLGYLGTWLWIFVFTPLAFSVCLAVWMSHRNVEMRRARYYARERRFRTDGVGAEDESLARESLREMGVSR